MEQVRDVVWERVSTSQQEKRESLLDKNRSLEETKCASGRTKEDVLKVAAEMKRKQVTFGQLSQLKEMFLADKENATAFLGVDGALEALVKALSGQNSKLQITAAYCLCNLSLGEQYLKIIKVAGPYLLVHLEGMNTYLIEACAWTLGNLSSHEKKCVSMLKKQGALSALSRLSHHAEEKVRVAAAYALSHSVFAGYDVLTGEDFEELIDPALSLFQMKDPSSTYLMSLLSGNGNCQLRLLQEGVHVRSLASLISSARKNILNCAWHVRIIANLITESTGRAAMQVVTYRESVGNATESLFDFVEYATRSGQIFLIKECCWLLGNLANHNNKDVCDRVLESGVIDKIANPVRYLLTSAGS